MHDYQRELADLLVRHEVVRFGEFTLKSGRRSPYFIDAGRLRSGAAIAGVGEAYAELMRTAGLACDLVFGPAYKGVPLAVATAIALARRGIDVVYGFDRKEQKSHGEGGWFVGAPPVDGMRVIVVDDVVTSGQSIREALSLLQRAARVEIVGVVVAVDRQERGRGAGTTLAELRDELGVRVHAGLTIRELAAHLHGRVIAGRVALDDAGRASIDAHLAEYGGTA